MEPLNNHLNFISSPSFNHLWDAVVEGDSNEIWRLIQSGVIVPYLEERELAGFREEVVALLVAIEDRDERLTLLHALLQAGLDIARTDSKGCIGLHYYLERGRELQNIWSAVMSNVSMDQLMAKDSLGRNALHYACAYCTEEQIEDLLRHLDPQRSLCDNEGVEPFHFSANRDIAYKVLAWMGQEDFRSLLEAGYCPKWIRLSYMKAEDKRRLEELMGSESFLYTLDQLRSWLVDSQDVLSRFQDESLSKWAHRVIANLGFLAIFARHFFGSSSPILKKIQQLRSDSHELYDLREGSLNESQRPACPVFQLEEERWPDNSCEEKTAFFLTEQSE